MCDDSIFEPRLLYQYLQDVVTWGNHPEGGAARYFHFFLRCDLAGMPEDMDGIVEVLKRLHDGDPSSWNKFLSSLLNSGQYHAYEIAKRLSPFAGQDAKIAFE